MRVRTEVDFGDEWERAIRALQLADSRIPREVNLSLKTITARAAMRASSKALSIPARGDRHRGTRARLSRGVGTRRTNVGYRVTTSMPAGEEMLPRGFQSQWTHPTFGGQPWVVQAPHYDWFIGPIGSEWDSAFRMLGNDLDDVAAMVDRMASG